MKLLSVLTFLGLMLIPNFVQAQSKDVADKKFWIVSTLLIGSTIYDVESTFYGLNRCKGGCHEGNWFMKPLVKAGQPGLYAVQGSIDAGALYVSYEVKKRGHKKLWLILPVTMTVAHLIGGTRNLSIALRF